MDRSERRLNERSSELSLSTHSQMIENRRRREPSLVLAGGSFAATLGYAAAHSPDILAAGGVVLLAMSAVAASPDLIAGPLRLMTGRRVEAAAARCASITRSVTLVLYAIVFSAILVGSLFAPGQAVAVLFAVALLVAGVEGCALMIRTFLRDLATGGFVDRRIGTMVGATALRAAAGTLFVVGTCFELASTFS